MEEQWLREEGQAGVRMPFPQRLTSARTRVMTVTTYIGTSGWHYDHWEGPFYNVRMKYELAQT
jgi:hypothetical protein